MSHDGGEQSPLNGQGGPFSGSHFHDFKDAMFIASQGNVHVNARNADATGEIRKLADWLTSINFRTIHRDTFSKRIPGTGGWLIESPKFCDWIEMANRILWIKGIPGAGKTVLLSIIIDHLERSVNTDKDAILYIYSRHEDDHSITELLASLVKQLVENTDVNSSVFRVVNDIYVTHKKKATRPVKEEFMVLLRKLFSSFTKVYVVLDALDEVPNNYQDHLIAVLVSLEASLLFSSRPMQIIDLPHDAIVVSVGDQNQADINAFVHHRLRENSHISRVLRGRGDRMDEVCTKIQKISDGMFLLASLQIESLRGCSTINKLSKALDLLPADLEATYHSALSRIDNQDGDFPSLAKRAITWLIYAYRSLKMTELMHALAIEDAGMPFDDENIPPQDLIVAVSCGMIEIHPESGVVRLVHYTAHNFFKKYADNLIPSPPAYISESCITYLTAFGFTKLQISTIRQFWDFAQTGRLIEYAYRNWISHVRQCDDETYPAEMVSDFVLQTSRYPILHNDWDLEWFQPCHVVAYYGLQIPLPWDELCNKRTTENHTPLTLSAIIGCDTVVESLLSCIDIDVNAQTHYGESALMFASMNGHNSVVTALLSSSGIDVNLRSKLGFTALIHASMSGPGSVINTLLSYRGINVNWKTRDRITALMYACLGGHSDVVINLLSFKEVDVNLRDGYGNTALACAVQLGHQSIVNALLSFAGIDVNLQNDVGDTVLISSSKNGNDEVVKALLVFQTINVNQQNNDGKTALISAASYGQNDVVKALLSFKGVNIDLQSKDGSTALMQAARQNHNSIVTALLSSHGTDINLQDVRGCSALILASEAGHSGIVNTLMSCRGIDVNLRTSEGLTALILASGNGENNMGIVKRLLSFKGIGVNVQSNDGTTVLMRACSIGHNEIVKILLSFPGINVNLQDECGRTALSFASQKGHQVIVDALLLFQDLDAYLQDNNGETALSFACKAGNQTVVKTLLSRHNIDVNLQNNNGDTSLIHVCKEGHQTVVNTLLSCHSIDVNLKNNNGDTALMHLCQRGHQTAVNALLSCHNVAINLQNNDGETALMHACNKGHGIIVTALLSVPGIDANLQNNHGSTALMYACWVGRNDVVSALLSFSGINVNLRNNFGDTALSYALTYSYQAIADALISFPGIDH